jgi:hypothetical protein
MANTITTVTADVVEYNATCHHDGKPVMMPTMPQPARRHATVTPATAFEDQSPSRWSKWLLRV